MPTVQAPTEQAVQEAGLPGVRVQDNSTLENFGGGQGRQAETQAAEGLGATATDLADQAKQRADQVAHIAADAAASKLQTDLQVQTSKLQGADALGAQDMVQAQWSEGIQKIRGSLSNAQQQQAFDRTTAGRSDELYKTVATHTAQQSLELEKQTTASYLDASKNAATVNAFDDDKVQAEIHRTTAVMEEHAKAHGTYLDPKTGEVSQIYKSALQDQLSSVYRDVIGARLDKDTEDGVDAAREFLAAHKEDMKATDYLAARNKLENAETIQQGNDAWDKVQGFRLSDGTPNEAKMESAVMNMDDLSDQKKQKIWAFVKARAGEAHMQTLQQQGAADRDFMNKVMEARKNGEPLSATLKLADDDHYGRDTYDQAVKAEQIQKVFAPPSQSDPAAFLALYEKVQDGSASRQDLNLAMNKNLINVADHRSLSEKLINQKLNPDEDPAVKQSWERVKVIAEQNFSDKKKKDAFMYYLHTTLKDAQGPEIVKGAMDAMQGAPGTGWFVNDKQYEVGVKKLDAQNIAWAQVHQDIGETETAAIGYGLSGGKQYGLTDIDAFSKNVGGYDKLKAGQPAGNAVRNLIKQGKVVTAQAVKKVLSIYPDGNF